MKTLVIGATGTIGNAIVDQLESAGHSVTKASRSSEHVIDLDDPQSIRSFFDSSERWDHIICAAGNASFGKLKDMDDAAMNLGFQSKLAGQINVVKYGVEKLSSSGAIILTGGMLAYSPWPETSNIATVNAGLEGFVKAASLEFSDGQRLLLVHPPFVAETAEAMGMDSSPWPKANKVANAYATALSGSEHGKPVFVDGYGPSE